MRENTEKRAFALKVHRGEDVDTARRARLTPEDIAFVLSEISHGAGPLIRDSSFAGCSHSFVSNEQKSGRLRLFLAE